MVNHYHLLMKICNENYLKALVKYIEFNPVKAGIVERAGEYPWAMSSHGEHPGCADFGLIDKIKFVLGMSIMGV